MTDRGYAYDPRYKQPRQCPNDGKPRQYIYSIVLITALDLWLASDALVIVKTRSPVNPATPLVGCDESNLQPFWVITSPNVDFIPQISIMKRALQPRRDGRFGLEDPTNAPQMFSPSFPFHTIMSRRPIDDNERRYLWKTVGLKDFIPVKGSVFSGLGVLCPEAVEKLARMRTRMEAVVQEYFEHPSPHAPTNQLKILVSQMRTTYQRIAYVPATYPDVVLAVSLFQRLWLEIDAWILYRRQYYDRIFEATPHSVDTGLMGAWSFHLHEVQKLYNAGIPTWWVRSEETIIEHTNINSQTHVTTPSRDIILEHFEDENGASKPFPVFHNGYPGEDRECILRWAVQYHLDPVQLDPGASTSVPSLSSIPSSTPASSSTSGSYDFPAVQQAVEKVVGVGSTHALQQVVKDVVQQCLAPQTGPDRPSGSQSSVRMAPYRMIKL